MRNIICKRVWTLLFSLVLICGTVFMAGCEFQEDDDLFKGASADVPAQEALTAENPATAKIEDTIL